MVRPVLVINAMREPEISEAKSETYRLLWLRTFHAPIAVRVTFTDDKAVLVAKLLSGAGGYEPGTLCARTTRCIEKPGAWKTDVPAGEKDRAQWIVEATLRARYSSEQARTQQDGELRDCAMQMLLLSGLPLDPIY